MGTHRFVGRVVEKATQNGIADLRVEARDLRRKISTPVATAVTNARGDFVLETVDENLKELFNGSQPVLYLQVIWGSNVLASTERTQRWAANRDGEGRVEVVSTRPLVTRPASPRQTVEGIVGVRDGDTLGSGLQVRVYERRLQLDGTVSETQVANATAGEDGSYRVGFDSDQVTSKLDLVVKTYDGANLVAASTLCKAPARATVDVVPLASQGARHQGPPRFNAVKNSVTRVALEAGTDPPISLATIQDSAHAYLACRAEVLESEVTALLEAVQLSGTYGAVAQDVFFALLTRGIPKGEVFAQRLSVVRSIIVDAADRGDIAPVFKDDIDAVVDAFEAAAVIDLSIAGSDPGRPFTSIGQLANIALSNNQAKREAFIKHALRNDGGREDFWTAVEADSPGIFTAADVTSLKFTADVAGVVANWPDMIATLFTERVNLNITHAREIAQYGQADWEAFITTTPPDTLGANEVERKANYAQFILSAVEQRFRTPFALYRYREQFPSDLGIDHFHQNNPEFDFAASRVARYVSDNDTALQNNPDPTGTVATLKQLERLYKVTSKWDDMKALRDAGLGSAADIHRAGAAGLQAVTSLDPDKIREILDNACWISWGAMALQVKYSAALNKFKIANNVLPNCGLRNQNDELMQDVGLPDWETLFGTLDQCACDHCRSVLSPSAYLVDVLQFLKRASTTATNARDTLLTRRPDINWLVLSCENGSTPRPYVDLVNEILEVKVAGGAWPAEPIDTSTSSAALLAHPDILFKAQYIAAYTTLANSLHPFSMPFHLWAKEARVYLEYLGVPRHLLVEKLAPDTPPNLAEYRRHLAIERLDLAPSLYDLFADLLPGSPDAWTFWGYASDPTLTTALAEVPTFLKRASLTYDELRELLNTDYTVSTGVSFADSTCKIDDLALQGLTDPWLAETHKLLRLRRVLGWSISDTAKARKAFSTTWAETVQAVGGLKLLQDRTALEPLELLAWYGKIDRWPADALAQAPVAGFEPATSLWERLFLNRSVLNPDEEAFRTLWGAESLPPPAPLQNRATGLLPALRIGRADFDLLTVAAVSKAELLLEPVVDGTSDPANVTEISRLYRYASAARASGLRIRDFRILHVLANSPALAGDAGAVTPDATLAFLGLVDRVRATNAPLDEVHYVLRHVTPSASRLEPTAETLGQWVGELESAIEKADADSDKIDDGTGELVSTLVDQLFPANATQIKAFIEDYESVALVADRVALVQTWAPFFSSSAEAVADLASDAGAPQQAPLITGAAERRTYLARALARHVSIASFFKVWTARTFGIQQEAADWLLTQEQALRWTPGGSPAHPAVFSFTRDADWDDAPKPSTENRKSLLLRIHKVSLLSKRFRWTNVDIRALFPATGTLPALALDEIPVERPTAPNVPADNLSQAQGRFAIWLRLADLARLRDAWRAGPEDFYAFLAAASSVSPPPLTELDAKLSDSMGWNVDDIAALRSPFAAVDGYKDERLLVRMMEAMALVARLGASAAQAIAWAQPAYLPPSPGVNLETPSDNEYLVAAEIKRVAKAKHGEETWAEIARPLRNVLRERQRATLVDHLIQKHPLWTSSNDVYADLLVDVEMAPCQLTSRLALAHSSVQLFMNRILLNLEPGLKPNEEVARQWQWMKTYRVWEANRKVFLWPENWIEPELRDDKTPLFRELENRLLQGPLDRQRVDAAYRGYLDGLADVANLEIVAVHEELQGPFDFNIASGNVMPLGLKVVLHVFGRSRASKKLYHRQRIDGRWTPWSKIDFDIEAQHLMPATIGGHLYLFWPQFATKPADVDRVPDQEVPEQLGLRFAWTELRSEGWVAPAFGPNEYVWLGGNPSRERLSFTIRVNAGYLEITGLGTRTEARGWRFAVFRFEPGTRTVSVDGLHKMQPWTAHPVAVNPPAATEVDIPPPASTVKNLQSFQREYSDGAFSTHLPLLNTSAMRKIFANAPRPFTIICERRAEPTFVRPVLFFMDDQCTFLLEQRKRQIKIQGNPSTFEQLGWQLIHVGEDHYYRIATFRHPYVAAFRQALALRGVDGLLRWADQAEPLQLSEVDISTTYGPTASNTDGIPEEVVDFSLDGAYGTYNWELFFHAPLLIATRLFQDGRHEEAQKWFHYIFDPTDGSSEDAPQRYWKVKPLYLNRDLATIQEDLTALSLGEAVETLADLANSEVATPASDTLAAQIDVWRNDPFNPHAIARLRIVTYQKHVFIKYVENLIRWGDQLFGRDTIESINEATQLYVLAQELLGEKPNFIEEPEAAAAKPYIDLGAVDLFSNAVIETEAMTPQKPAGVAIGCGGGSAPPELIWGTTYFCVPPNEMLLGLWDVVADRLFKIRNCMNIEGIVRALPLFQPPIDPALLVRAAAAKLDLSMVLNDINVAAPPYRFAILYAKAQDFVSSVISLGAVVLSTLEKQDAEALSNLRARHELAMNDLVREVRKSQVAEAKQNIKTLEQSLRSAQERQRYYGAKPRVFEGEREALNLQRDANVATQIAGGLNAAASVLHAFPTTIGGFAGAFAEWGPTFLGNMLQAGASVSTMVATQRTFEAGSTETMEGYKRRKEDWEHQTALAKIEVEQINRDILAAQIRLDVAEKELANLEKQLEQSREVETFLRTKFTNEDLYGWMKGQLQGVYHQAYDLAYKMAKTAQRAFQYERGDDEQTFISYGNWNGVREGLLAGEKLANDLRRMDAAYHAQNKRELELVKMVSLAEHDPDQLVELRENGSANISLTADHYDRDFATHYMRRLKSISVTVPCTTGPYQGVHGTLSLLKGATRVGPESLAVVKEYTGAIQNIATSQGQSDSGMFELNFRDDRLLPFEGVGAHLGATSGPQWTFNLSKGNRFSYQSIDDLVLDIRYTARPGGAASAQSPRTLKRLVRVREEFADAWQAFLEGDSSAVLVFELPASGWPRSRNEALATSDTVGALNVYGRWQGVASPVMELWAPGVTPPLIDLSGGNPVQSGNDDSMRKWSGTANHVLAETGQTWTVKPSNKASLQDLWIVFTYVVTVTI